jgi:hypothetical protein
MCLPFDHATTEVSYVRETHVLKSLGCRRRTPTQVAAQHEPSADESASVVTGSSTMAGIVQGVSSAM